MDAGLQTFDAAGNLKQGIGDRIARFLGIFFFSAGASGSIVIDGLLTGSPFYSATPHGSSIGFGANNEIPPSISFSGNVMSYAMNNADTRVIVWVH